MSFCFVILYVTIWCKDNKLIIYLSKWQFTKQNNRKDKIKAIEVTGSNDSHDSDSNHEAADMSSSVRANKELTIMLFDESNCTTWLQGV